MALSGLAVGFGAVTAVLWEFAEYWTFIRNPHELATAYTDTLGDLALGLTGSVAALLTVWLARRPAVDEELQGLSLRNGAIRAQAEPLVPQHQVPRRPRPFQIEHGTATPKSMIGLTIVVAGLAATTPPRGRSPSARLAPLKARNPPRPQSTILDAVSGGQPD